jgi:phospholipid transport system substrate-binding protein
MKTLPGALASALLVAFASLSPAQAQSPQPAPAARDAAPATAALAPDDLVKKVTSDVLEAIKSDRQLAAGDRDKALKLAEEKILPHVDFREAVRLAVGRPWAQATPDQQERLTAAFRQMLVRSYSNALDSYQGQTMRVLPSRVPANAEQAAVRNQYLRQGAPPVMLEYAMRRTPEGWKIYDITVEGISLVLTYRGQFEQVAKQSGIDALIRAINEKNTPAAKPG